MQQLALTYTPYSHFLCCFQGYNAVNRHLSFVLVAIVMWRPCLLDSNHGCGSERRKRHQGNPLPSLQQRAIIRLLPCLRSELVWLLRWLLLPLVCCCTRGVQGVRVWSLLVHRMACRGLQAGLLFVTRRD